MKTLVQSRLLPVLDIKDGRVVRGVGGRRDEYRPIESRWTTSSDPLDVARAMRSRFGFNRFYVADLGAICERKPHTREIESLLEDGFELDLDCGIRRGRDCAAAVNQQGVRIVIGLETIESPTELERAVAAGDADRIVFSVDLMNGRPMGNAAWPASPLEVISRVREVGITSLIVLDLAAVGVNLGCPTLPLCREIRSIWSDAEITTGGGIRSNDDVLSAIESGVDRVLVSTALHDGRME